jgi:rhodanese-related sulfurtransferase
VAAAASSGRPLTFASVSFDVSDAGAHEAAFVRRNAKEPNKCIPVTAIGGFRKDATVHVLEEGFAWVKRVPALGEDRLTAEAIDVAGLADALARAAVRVIDVGASYWYRSARIPGSAYAMRSNLAAGLATLPPDASLVFCCNDGRLARHAAQDAIALCRSDVHWLEGGRAAWRASGRPVEACAPGDGDPLLLTDTDDMWYPPWARGDDVEADDSQEPGRTHYRIGFGVSGFAADATDLATEQALSLLHARTVAALAGWTPATPGLGDVAEQGAEFRLYDAEDSAHPASEFLARFTILAVGPAGGPWSS